MPHEVTVPKSVIWALTLPATSSANIKSNFHIFPLLWLLADTTIDRNFCRSTAQTRSSHPCGHIGILWLHNWDLVTSIRLLLDLGVMQMQLDNFPRWPSLCILALGGLLHAFVLLGLASTVNWFSIWISFLALLPYVVCTAIAFRVRGWGFPALLGGIGAITLDVYAQASVFMFPSSSTSALNLLFAPYVSLVFGAGTGILIGYLVLRYRSV